MRLIWFSLLFACLTLPAFAQQNSQTPTRTISVTAEGTSETEADVAVIVVTCHDYGATHQDAYQGNARRGNQLLDALLKAGVEKSAIETSSVEIIRPGFSADWTPQEKAERQYEATQTLTIRAAAKNASTIIDLAMHSGANGIKSVNWELSDPAASEAKANAAALAKAKETANQLATGIGVKLGEIVSISNGARFVGEFSRLQQYSSLQDVRWIASERPISLVPEKIKTAVTVNAMFAIQ